MRNLHPLLAIAGGAIPYYFLVSFLVEYGLDLPLLVHQLFATDTSTFFAVDVILTALALLVFIYRESQRRAIRSGPHARGPSPALPFPVHAPRRSIWDNRPFDGILRVTGVNRPDARNGDTVCSPSKICIT